MDLRTEYQQNPLSIAPARPRLSWVLSSVDRDVDQSSYEIRVATDLSDIKHGTHLLYDTGRIRSDASIQVPYAGPALLSKHRYYWQVRVWDQNSVPTRWSQPASWEMGLLSSDDWKASWIEPPPTAQHDGSRPSPFLRFEFSAQGGIARARAYITSHGLYEFFMNGHRIGNALFTPGWTSYSHRLQYQTYDVTALMREGRNAVGAVLGDGWYRGTLGPSGQRDHFGSQLALIAQIEITYEDGHTQLVTSNGQWRTSTGAILYSDIYNGETYDARLELTGWNQPGYDDSAWVPVRVIAPVTQSLVVPVAPPVRAIEERAPIRIFQTSDGVTIADMGQNMVGRVRLRVHGPAGTVVTLRHGEILDSSGRLYTDNLRTAKQKIEYILKGTGEEVFEPHFTFQGFRYVAITGYPGRITPSSLTGIVIHSDLPPTGSIETSNGLINQLQHNILWSQKGNFLDLPTDCPQRDERLGWTADAQIFSATAVLNMEAAGFYAKWLADLGAEQRPDGALPWESPNIIKDLPAAQRDQIEPPINRDGTGAAGWGDAITIVPWNLYLNYADTAILDARYSNMVRWVGYEQSRAGAHLIWTGDFQFGDWLAVVSPEAPGHDNVEGGSTSTDLIATAFFAHSVDILSRTAQVLHKQMDAARYQQLFERICTAFQSKFVHEDGSVGDSTQTAYVLALDFDLLPVSLRQVAARHLAEDVRQRGHLTTGLLGTARLLNVLSRFGYLDEAYSLLLRTEYPSWLYPITRGATTLWERWDGIEPSGARADPEMNSYNHYIFGGVGEWLYRTVAGIDLDLRQPGYKHVLFRPQPGGGLTHVRGRVQTQYGPVSSEWTLTKDVFRLVVEVPPNTRATIRLPWAKLEQISTDSVQLQDHVPVSAASQEADALDLELGSGRYTFHYAWHPRHASSLVSQQQTPE
jgi:alpha-L-rhamnosidase